jgi:hypothetical protein
VQSNTKFATTCCVRRDGGGVPDDVVAKGQVVELGTRSRRGAPAIVPEINRDQSPALALLTPEERTALNLTASDDPLPRSGSLLLAAASGLAKLAAAHVARCLVADTDVRELTRKDRLALAFAPRLSADVHRVGTTDAPSPEGHDPIVALLECSRDTDRDDVIVRARLELGPRHVDLIDERSRSD